MSGHASAAGLIGECRRPGLPGIVPSERFSLAAVPELLLAELTRSERGVVVLGVDGLAHRVADRCWPSAEISYLTSTVPSTSATAWLTALTGCGPQVHGVPGMVYRVGGRLVYAVTGEGLAGEGAVPPGAGVSNAVPPGAVPSNAVPPGAVSPGAGVPRPVVPPLAVLPSPTVFERAAAAGARCVALGRELDHLPGPWAPALLRGAARAGGSTTRALVEQAADPGLLAGAVIAEVAAVLAEPADAPVLAWAYVNLDDHVHANGYDDRALAAMRRLDRAAGDWAAGGWTVVAHSDHGQVPVRPDPALSRAWAAVDDPTECELPAGGAGRFRWLHPRAGREDAVRARLADALGDAAVVVHAPDLPLPPRLALPPDRIGAVIAIAASDRFPLPDPTLRYEHGGLDPDEMVIPWAVWRPPRR